MQCFVILLVSKTKKQGKSKRMGVFLIQEILANPLGYSQLHAKTIWSLTTFSKMVKMCSVNLSVYNVKFCSLQVWFTFVKWITEASFAFSGKTFCSAIALIWFS